MDGCTCTFPGAMNRRPPLVKWAPSCPNVFLFAHQDLRLMEIATEVGQRARLAADGARPA